MSNYVRRLETEVTYYPHTVCLTWKNPDFEEFDTVRVYRDPSIAFSYFEDNLEYLEIIYEGTAEKIYDYDLTKSAVEDINDVPFYFEQSSTEQSKRLEGEKTYKYYVVTLDTQGNKFGSEKVSITAVTTKYYGLGKQLYNELPEIYRSEDVNYNYPLKRFMEIVGQFYDYLKSVTNMNMILRDPQKIPSHLLPLLSEHYGAFYYHDIPAIYQRRFLSQVGEFIGTKGTEPTLRFIASKLVGGYHTTIEKVSEDTYRIRIHVPLTIIKFFLTVEFYHLVRYLERFIPINIELEVFAIFEMESIMPDLNHELATLMKKGIPTQPLATLNNILVTDIKTAWETQYQIEQSCTGMHYRYTFDGTAYFDGIRMVGETEFTSYFNSGEVIFNG